MGHHGWNQPVQACQAAEVLVRDVTRLKEVLQNQLGFDHFRIFGDGLREVGWSYYKLGVFNKSIDASSKALDIDPGRFPVRFNLALALLCAGRSQEGADEYRKAMEHISNPTDLRDYAMDDLEEAIKERGDLPLAAEILNMLKEEDAFKESRRHASGARESSRLQ
jgi:tetratricopeptide (TPR) repeat protein